VADGYDVVVLGAGAAGLMCAAEAGKRGRRVVVLEGADAAGKKILISGGGRCNFTNVGTGPENFLSSNPHFAKSALARYTPADFVTLVEKHRIAYHEKKLGQLFCDRSASDITNLLLAECRAGGVRLVTSCRINAVRRTTEFVIETEFGDCSSPVLVVATGGLSIPMLGATGFGFHLARQFGHKVVQPRPALVPVVLTEPDRRRWCDLAGVATDAIACFDGHCFAERILITHRGLSGPAVLQISSYWDGRGPLTFDLLPGRSLSPDGSRSLRTTLATALPKRLADRWMEQYDSVPSVEALVEALHRWQVTPSGTEGFARAEVTAGGVGTDELSSKTMASRKVPGLYFIGEVVDVTGHLGGYNFQWAWASGWVAGQTV
jgi:predicted Rossmann fold flavoprotein